MGTRAMAIVWSNKSISHYGLLWRSENHQVRGIALKASYVILHQVDLVLTVLAVYLGFSELNPLMRDLLATPLQLVVVKLVIPLLIAWFVPSKFLIPAIALLAIVVGWNVKELLFLLI